MYQDGVGVKSLEDDDPLLVKIILEYCYTDRFNESTPLSDTDRSWSDVEQRLHTCITTYAAAHKFRIEGLKSLVLKSGSLAAFGVVSHANLRLSPIGAGRLIREAFETFRVADLRLRVLILCEVSKCIDTLAQNEDFLNEVDQIKGNFWRKLARFNATIKSQQKGCEQCHRLSHPSQTRPFNFTRSYACPYCIGATRRGINLGFDWLERLAPVLDSEPDSLSDEESVVILTPSTETIC
ncbi:hypothetical protein IWZ01DRAFT_485028 [Phyllosticta capitalensis]